jgi:glycosyltransferase involved in cell wall biosynthesis
MSSKNASSLVSIVIPCFNREALVKETIESALNQKNAAVEVVVVDDGSCDNSWSVIQSYGARITAIRTENRGVSMARNAGVASARGDWVKFLDSDDQLLPGAIALQLAQADASPPRSIPVGQLTHERHPDVQAPFAKSMGASISAFSLGSHPLQVSRPLLPISAIQACRGFRKSSISEDHELMIRIALQDFSFIEFQSPVVFFREHDGAERLSSRISAARFQEVAGVYARLLNELHASGHPMASDFRAGIAQSAWSMGRRAARHRFPIEARALFALARQAGDRELHKAKFPLNVLCRFLDPVLAERLAEAFKGFSKHAR